MNEKVKDVWIKALLSGEYEQGREKLVRPTDDKDEYCCLGVLCEIAPKTLGLSRVVDNWGDLGYVVEGVHVDTFPPERVAKWAGLDFSDQEKLAQLNDGSEDKELLPQSFEQIAAYIRDNL